MIPALALLVPVLLRRTPTVDARATYAIRAVIELGGDDDVRFTGSSKERVAAVEDGTIATSVETKLSVDVMGVVREGRTILSTRTERTDGTLVTPAKLDPTALFATSRTERLRVLFAPAAPVEIGEGWWRTAPKGEQGAAFSSYSRLEGEEKAEGRDAWRVSTDAREAGDDAPVRVRGMLWIDKTDGSLVRGQWTIEGFTYSPTAPPGNARLEYTRVG